MSFSESDPSSELGLTASSSSPSSSSSCSSFSLCSFSSLAKSGESERRAAGDFERRDVRDPRLVISGDLPIRVVCGSASDSSEDDE